MLEERHGVKEFYDVHVEVEVPKFPPAVREAVYCVKPSIDVDELASCSIALSFISVPVFIK